MIHDDTPDPVAAAAVERRREQVRVTARQLLAAHAAGATVDPHSLQWARDVKALGRPANGWLGDPTPAHARAHSTPETPK